MSFLEHIECPADLRKLSPAELLAVSDEVRGAILEVVSQKGGHFGSNLGAVELTVALHYVFDTPRDKLVWDVGHQAYGHKILTGRRDRFSTIRQENGLSGFTSRAESPYDHFGAGHASTSLSAALGICEALKHQGLPNLGIAIVGDGSLTGGLVYEAMNNAGHIPAKNLLVVLNDNDMSIDPNVGALSKFINQAITHPGYNRMRKDMKALVDSLSSHGVPLDRVASKVRKSVKNFFSPGILFECFGFRYFGPVDGHNLEALLETFQFIKNEGAEGGPYFVHAITTKGKGYKLAEENRVKYHGVNPFCVNEGISAPAGAKKPNYQDVFADTLIQLAKEDPRVLAITAAMPSGTSVNKFQKEFPGRTYDVGIAEGHAVLFAAGLATEGYRPVVAIYSTFLQRAYDQLIHDVALQNLPVIFAMDRAGVVGADGATHQGTYDLAYLRSIPSFVVMAPKDENELRHMLKTAVAHSSAPTAIRYPRGEVVGVPLDETLVEIPIGKGELLACDHTSVDVTLVAVGFAVQSALAAKAKLNADGISVAVINARFVKPLDAELIHTWAKKSRLVVTIEENTVLGGFGSAVSESLHSAGILRHTLCLGMPDKFIEHAAPAAQRKAMGIDAEGIARQTLARLAEWKLLPEKAAAAPSSQKPSTRPVVPQKPDNQLLQ